MKLLTKDEVMGMSMHQMSEYLNKVCKANNIEPFLVWQDGTLFDADDMESPISDAPELFDMLLDYDNEATDLQGKVFADN